MTEEQMEKFALIMGRALQQSRSVSDSEHFDHHKWISARIKASERRADFWRMMLNHAAKWGMISVLSAGLYALYLGLLVVLNHQPK